MAVIEIEPELVLREEIDRFMEATRERSEYDVGARRRAKRRYHRSWPMLVRAGHRGAMDVSVALHNASEVGVAFLSGSRFEPGQILFLKLFWSDQYCPRVPASVQYAKEVEHGLLVGCAFVLDDVQACARAVNVRDCHI